MSKRRFTTKQTIVIRQYNRMTKTGLLAMWDFMYREWKAKIKEAKTMHARNIAQKKMDCEYRWISYFCYRQPYNKYEVDNYHKSMKRLWNRYHPGDPDKICTRLPQFRFLLTQWGFITEMLKNTSGDYRTRGTFSRRLKANRVRKQKAKRNGSSKPPFQLN
jgi:hypothetical protein